MTGDHIILFGLATLAALSVVGVFALLLQTVEEIVEKAMDQNESPRPHGATGASADVDGRP